MVKYYYNNPSVTALPCHLPLHKGGFLFTGSAHYSPSKWCHNRKEPIQKQVHIGFLLLFNTRGY